MCQVLFLDIDGVLHPAVPHGEVFRPECLERLSRVLKQCKNMPLVILSSTWRKDEALFMEVEQQLAAHQVKIFGSTSISGYTDRVDEICAWLEAWKTDIWEGRGQWCARRHLSNDPCFCAHEAYVSSFVVVDDDISLQGDVLKGRLVHTDPSIGLDEEAAARMLECFHDVPANETVAATLTRWRKPQKDLCSPTNLLTESGWCWCCQCFLWMAVKKKKESSMVVVPCDASKVSHIFFTSGSTGRPKGCVVSHGALESYCRAKNEAYDVAARHAVVLVASAFTFDPSLGDFMSAWSVGASIALGPRTGNPVTPPENRVTFVFFFQPQRDKHHGFC
eukprot:symbB.v1.2.013051.t2/scaffold868.1/size293455/6